jgi:hypothetical protein
MTRWLRRTALLGPALAALGLAGLNVAPADAAAFTSTGVRCTIVGTSGADVLTGTSGRDVICGLGGNDVIRARGGNDLVDAGGGKDTVVAGAGNDRVLAGSGADRVSGGDGADRISGGTGADDVNGGAGADLVSGGPGPDALAGDGGADVLSGGDGGDTIEGGTGQDDLNGQQGDDDLTGDGGADDLDGGAGSNICIVDAADDSVRCRYDEQPPALVEAGLSPGSVDVSVGSAEVTVRVHATDDTGVEDVQVGLHSADYQVQLGGPPLELVEGDQRDGWWQATFEVPRWLRPATLRPTVYLRDRLKRQTSDDSSPARLAVSDANPDTQPPQLTLLAPVDAATVDVRTASKDVTVKVRATDDVSGVARVDLCLARPAQPLYQAVICQDDVPRASGSVGDGVYQATLTLPKGSLGGDWNVQAYTEDRASSGGAYWLGPDAYPGYQGSAGPTPYPFPDGQGRLPVQGASDSRPAWTDSVTLDPAEVDTLTSAATTHVTVHALDAAGEGVTAVSAVLVSDSELATAPQFDKVDLQQTDGDMLDGTWQGDLVLDQGTPVGTYHVLVFVDDISHSRGYVGSGSPYATGYGYTVVDGDPHVTVVEHQ